MVEDHEIYESAIRPPLQYRFRSMTRDWLKLKQADRGSPVVVNSESKVLSADIVSKNGVVKVVDTVLQCPCLASL